MTPLPARSDGTGFARFRRSRWFTRGSALTGGDQQLGDIGDVLGVLELADVRVVDQWFATVVSNTHLDRLFAVLELFSGFANA